MPTIAYIAGQFPKRSETFVYREVRELRRRGWDVVCVTLHEPDDLPEDAEDLLKDRVRVYGGGFGSSPTAVLRGLRDALFPGEPASGKDRLKLVPQTLAATKLAWELARRGVTHIHCHFAHAPTTVGMYSAAALGVPFSFTGHANDLFQRRVLLKRKLERAAFVSCISEEHRRLYRTIVPRDDVAAYPVIRCGVDVSSFAPVTSTRREDTIRVLTVCRLVPKKGVDTLVRAIGQLGEPGKRVRLVIAGDGPQRGDLEALVDELKLRDRVTFLGPVSNERVRGLLAETDVFALPCRTDASGDKDGIPVVLMEAMASGVAAISGDLPAIRELVDGTTGLLVDGDSPAATATALARLIDDDSLRQRLADAGRRRVVEEFSLATNVARLEAALRGGSTH